MGRGDKKSKKGKIWRGSFGKSRSRAAIKERVKRIASSKSGKVEGGEEEKPKTKRTVKKKESAE